MRIKQTDKGILFICGGNSCRSPMAEVILERQLEAAGWLDRFEVDSAAFDEPTQDGATDNARDAIKQLFESDLLAFHKAKKLTPELVDQADLILVMASRMKRGLPIESTWTLKEYAGESGDIADPYGCSLQSYIECASEISSTLDRIVPTLE